MPFPVGPTRVQRLPHPSRVLCGRVGTLTFYRFKSKSPPCRSNCGGDKDAATLIRFDDGRATQILGPVWRFVSWVAIFFCA